ncbi:MAG: hypothetical protein LIP23_08230 [Planctomycetes bacterium]|nr:hypothetical protein [Planctomycetota bacterium]
MQYGKILCCAVLALTLTAATAAAAEPADPDTAARLRAVEKFIDDVRNPVPDATPEARSSRGAQVNQAFVALTGEAVNPLFGITALGIYNYVRTDPALREYLPIYDQPVVWIPLLVILALMLFNSTIAEAMPFLKVPLNALGDLVNKAGAVAVLPLVVKMFADAVAQPAGVRIAEGVSAVFPVAYAGEMAGGSFVYNSLGWLAGAVIAVFVYAAVWLTFNVVDVLILICPFPGVDAVLKSMRLAVVGVLAGLNHLSPPVAMVFALFLVVVSIFVAGWSFRLSVFGLVFSTDILFFRKWNNLPDNLLCFVAEGAARRFNLPMRTLGRIAADPDGTIRFRYRPWLILGERSVELGKADDFAIGIGLLNPFLVDSSSPDTPWLRFSPRFGGFEQELAETLKLPRVVPCGVAGSIRNWLSATFGKSASTV